MSPLRRVPCAFLLLLLCLPPIARPEPLTPAASVAAPDPEAFRVARHADGYLLLRLLSRSDGAARIDGQRISAAGELLDAQPVHLGETAAFGAWQVVSTAHRTFLVTPAPRGTRLRGFDAELRPSATWTIDSVFVPEVAASEDAILAVLWDGSLVRVETYDPAGLRLGGATVFGANRDLQVAAAAIEGGFVVVAAAAEWNETRAVRIERSGRAGDVRVIAERALRNPRLVSNGNRLLLLDDDSSGAMFGRMLDWNAEVRSDAFRLFRDEGAFRPAAAGVVGGFLIAAEHGARIGFVPDGGGTIVQWGVLGAPGTVPSAAAAGGGDALFVYRSAGTMTARLVAANLATVPVEVRAEEPGEQTDVAAASAGERGLVAWREWNGAEWEVRAIRVEEGRPIDVAPLVLGAAPFPFSPGREIDVAESSGAFAVLWNRGVRRIGSDGIPGPLLANPGATAIAATEGGWFLFGAAEDGIRAWRLEGGGGEPEPIGTIIPGAYPAERIRAARVGARIALVWDDFVPCPILCPFVARIRMAVVDSSPVLVAGPLEVMSGIDARITADESRIIVVSDGAGGAILAVFGPGGERLDGRSADDPLRLATGGRLLAAHWDGRRWLLLTEGFAIELGETLELEGIRAIGTSLWAAPSAALVAGDRGGVVVPTAAGWGVAGGGVPRLALRRLARSPAVDLSIRAEYPRGRPRLRELVVRNHSSVVAQGVTISADRYGVLARSAECWLAGGSRLRCRRNEGLAPGGVWRIPLVDSRDDWPLSIMVGAEEVDLHPDDNVSASLTERVGPARRRPSARE